MHINETTALVYYKIFSGAIFHDLFHRDIRIADAVFMEIC